MFDQFYSFNSISLGIFKVLILMLIGYSIHAAKLIKEEGIEALSNILLWVCFPALMIAKITSSFIPSAFPGWWLLPIAAIAMSSLGLAVGYLFQKPIKNFNSRKEFMSACAFQNSGYLPMTLVAFICKGEVCDRLLVYIFLFLIGFNLTIWGFVPAFLSKNFKKDFKLNSFLNQPLVATVFSVITVFLFGAKWIPEVAYDPLKMLGEASFPLSLLILGATLSEEAGHIPLDWRALASCTFAKLIALPMLVLIMLRYSPFDVSYKFFILLQSAMPSAISLVVIGSYTKADNKFFSGTVFYSHLFAIVTIPIWLYISKIFF
ncbi:MAG: hypothetical protein COS99_07465 [Candidatus Omnitrophica bacterium CG07_land_8_20_14_0_80_42_15]|uniref:Transporter n=1 Tax=Candidatus Aquitaenariimonas noxiae TaxID=1974741 RepID=A0A2J0KTQ7_9BACT|nr:MAG: hypothetical protein COS99_07465 [Candidatus Omnitrophica bacterium CG07_land_8_20_14_0_80_42_15]